ncbi:sigma-E processing peptidase SpoIIGA [Brevibacillus laterosporus]|uniref:sigma-E processing peptidase SpoIIGA n=1 Tax=Brevibacillus laterosporus TaxID=1465 RepID=UPI0014446A4A|nr:sigma-E processing peptidase SpoIIGA [Brevibacillus laterosporus]NKQ20779.1 sigma-E processing peptidase SpoIIGA [Brevibacillus laterosporus]WNX30095.1 sigma-E processing peptidase SpoIIGA [Brevibacillus laterosporus]
MVVYLDIILLLNFVIDALLLWFTAFFRKERIVWWRLLLASAVGSCYVAFYFFPFFSGIYAWFTKLLFSLFILWIAFGFKRLTHFLHHLAIFYFISFVFGGGVYALTLLTTSQNEIIQGIVVTHNDSFGVGTKPTLLIVCLGIVLVFLLSRKSYQSIQEPRKIEAFLVEVEVKISNQMILCRGLVDTGNQLHEPITRIPVMVMECRLFEQVLPLPILEVVREEGEKLQRLEKTMDELPLEWQGQLRLVPFRSVSRGMDFMVAIRPEQVTVIHNGLRLVTERVLIGLNPIALSADGRYESIVHPALIQREEINEVINETEPVQPANKIQVVHTSSLEQEG